MNDTVATAEDLGNSLTGEMTHSIDFTGATRDLYEPGNYYYDKTLWFTWTAPAASAPDTVDTVQFDLVYQDPDNSYSFGFTIYQLMVGGPYPAHSTPDTFEFWQSLSEVGNAGYPFRVEPGRTYYLQASQGGTVGETLTHLKWQPGWQFSVGPWIQRDPITIAGTNSRGTPVVAINGTGRQAQWVADQTFGGPVLAYDYPQARDCSFFHVKAGDLIDHWDPYDFSTFCPYGHYNDSWFSGYSVGLAESWDHGGFLVAAFYDMSLYQVAVEVSLKGAIQAPLPGPTAVTAQGQLIITETQADPAWNGNAFSDRPNANVLYQNEVVDWNVPLTSGGAVSQHGFMIECRHQPDGPYLPDKTDQVIPPRFWLFDVPEPYHGYPYFTPDQIGGMDLIWQAVIPVFATSFAAQQLSGTGAQLKDPMPDDQDPLHDPWYTTYPSRDFFIIYSSHVFDGAPPSKLGAAIDLGSATDTAGFVLDQTKAVATVIPPPYRYLTRKGPVPDIAEQPGNVNVKYNPIKTVSVTS